jgi:hypothetical protein
VAAGMFESVNIRHQYSSGYASASHAVIDYVWQQAAVPGAG